MRGHFAKFIYLPFSLLQHKSHALITRHGQQPCCSAPSPPPAAHGYLMLNVSVITLGAVSVPPGCGMRQLCSGRTRSLLQDCSAEQLCPASPLGAGLLEPERRKQHRQETSTPEIPGCRYPIVFSFAPHAGCWMFKRYRKIAPVIQQQISDAQKQNTKTAA